MTATQLTADSFQSFIGQSERLIVDFYDPRDPDTLEHAKALEEALRMVRSNGNLYVPFAKVDAVKEAALAERYVKNGRYPQLVWFAHSEPTQYHRTLRTASMIADFVMALDRDSVADISKLEEAGDYNRAVVAEIRKSSPFFKTVDAVAQRHMDTVAFTHLESEKEAISWVVDGVFTKYEGPKEVDALDRWVRSMLPLKSEAVPQGEMAVDEGSRVVVAKNFEEVVLQNDKDVMLLVYAPWCGYCKKLAPAWRQLASALEGNDKLMVAKMDGDRNGSPFPEDFSWNAYPTIFYVNAGRATPQVYRGNRTFDSLLGFARSQSTWPAALEFTANNLSDNDFDL
eukprot:CAMPEP_0178425482 /NCGR_PEP_ID=MMETSP0689_2-20121128/28746_1 /TAXON_ID=160604 /ORGANISM="Amphidinium massartii, Strain CS-259" /LENGTH=340 /DNA_ID=CAMNT_0020047147 /DNA_START=114 /DNA_END=1136 /DNA_ORIENTATION=-